MSNLSAPTVHEPIYECATVVGVSGYVPGATIDIYAEPPMSGTAVRIGSGVSNSATGQVFGVASANMVAGAKITAVQTYMGSTSPPSPEVVVQTALSVDAPVLTAPLLECAKCVRVDGLLPGVSVEVRDAVTTLGNSSTAGATASIWVSPPLVANHTITARQLYCGNPGADSPGITVGAVKEQKVKLAPPEVASPLFACQQNCVIEGCMPGCQVELFEDGMTKSMGCVAGTAINFGVSGGLVQGRAMTARQSLCSEVIKSPVSTAVMVQPAANIPKPVIWPPLYEGDTSVLLGMMVRGEIVSITADGIQIGMAGVGGGNALLNVDPPLVAGQKVLATVELCSVKKDSFQVTVLPAPKNIPPPKIAKPLNACSLLVNVTDCIPGAEIRVYAESGRNTVLLGLNKKTLGAATTVWITPPLKVGWLIYATQKVGGLTSLPSAAVSVDAPSTAKPKLVTPILACSRCVRLEQLIVGARIDVYQNNVWFGGTYAAATTANIAVYPELSAGATITATQTVCGKLSKADKVNVTKAPEKGPDAPKLLPAFADKSFVEATNLVIGATVEVEEVSIYNQVVGKTCAHANAQAIGLNIPLFAGAKLRARQTLCTSSKYSNTIEVPQPEEWPLGVGSFSAGFRLVADVPISSALAFQGSISNGCEFVKPDINKAVIFYPATSDGQDTPLAAGDPFPVVVFGPGRRWPSCSPVWEACLGAPTETQDDYRNYSAVLSHLARWGFVSIAPDMSWLASDFSIDDWGIVLADAVSYIISENTKSGSPFEGKLKTAGISLVGHSTSAAAAIELAVSGQFNVDALVLLAPASGSGINFSSVFNFAPNPVIVFWGTQDSGSFGGGESVNFYAAAGPKKHMVTIEGANHYGYSDSLCILADPTATISQADQQRITKAYLTAFLRRYVNVVLEVENYLTGARQVEELEAFSITVDAQT